MTIRTPAYLKTVFESNDIPTGSDYSDIFDSFLPISTSSKQTFDFPLEILGDVTASGAVYAQDFFTNGSVNASAVNATIVSASVVNTNRINANMVSASGGEFNLINAQNISASAARVVYFRTGLDTSVAATGTTTAAAKSLTEAISVIKSVTSAAQDALIISRHRAGFVQTIITDVSASCKVYPTSGAKFNNLANGAAFDIPDRKVAQIYHITSAQYYTATFNR